MSGFFEEGRVERLKLSAREIVSGLGLDLKERGGRLRGNAPWRSDSNSGGFSVDPATGGWTDFARGESGDVLDLVARALNLADRARDRFPEVLAEAEALAGFRASGPDAAPSLEILERRERERKAAALEAAQDDGRINGPWRRFSDAQAEARFAFLAEALNASARAFFAEGYSIPELPEAPAAVAPFLYPSTIKEVDPDGSKESREGFLYAARSEGGALEAVKFKTRARTLSQGKRASRGVWGNKAALIGAELLRLAEGGAVIVTAGEEKALAGNAWALRAGAPFVFVASLFGEGFGADHGPKQARRIVEAGPARIILAGDADAAGAKFNRAWRDGLFASDWPLERIGFLRWPEGSPKGFDINDALAAEGPDALFARIAGAPPMPAPEPAEAPAPAPIRGRAARARRKLSPAEAFTMPEPVRVPLAVIRRNLRERFEGLPEGGKLLAAAGTGTGKTFAAAGAVAAELRRRTRRGDPLPRVLIAAETNLWKDWREALEGRGIAADRIAELPGRSCETCRLHGLANELRAKGQNVARLLCGRGMKDPETTGEAGQGGEAWTPCAEIVRENAAAKGHKAEPGCQGAKGQTGYVERYETARRAAVVLTTPERLFGLGFDRLEGDWPFGFIIVDEGVDKHLLPDREIPAAADGIWRRRLDRLEGGRGVQEIPGLELASLGAWLDRLLEGVRPERAKLLESDATRRRKEGGGRSGGSPRARIAERDAWTAWAREAWPEEADPAGRLAEEVSDLLGGLRGWAGLLPFERARSAQDAPPAGFREYFAALARDLSRPEAEPWLVCESSDRGPLWRIVEPCSDNLAPLRDPARRVIVLDATPSSVARAILGEFGFESFEAQAPDETRIVHVRGPVNGTGHLAEPKEPAEGFLLPADRERFEARHAKWREAWAAWEAGLIGILERLGADPARAVVLTHKGRKDSFERLRVGTTFGKHRGTNALAEFSSLLQDGRSEPPSEEAARQRALLSLTLDALGVPEPALHPLIALSRPDERPGLQTRRRFVQYIGAEAEPRAVSVFSTGNDAVDSWILERREREALQCVGRLRGPDRAANEAEPGLVVIVTDDPLGLVPVDVFLEWSEPAEAFEAAAAGLNERRKKDAAERDASRLEALERAVAEIRLGGGALSGRAISGQAGLDRRTMERTLERLGLSLAELIAPGYGATEKVRPEKRRTLGLYKNNADARPGEGAPGERKKEERPATVAGPEPVELGGEASKEAAGPEPLPGALAEAAALGDQGAFESALAGARTPEQVPEGGRAWAKDAAEALAVAASSPSLAGWLPALIRLSADPVRDGSEALRHAVGASNGPAVAALLAEGASPTLPGRGGMGSALSLARRRSAPASIDRALVAGALAEFGFLAASSGPGPEQPAEPGALLRERLADPAGRASLAEWFRSEASRRDGSTRERPLAEALRAALAAMMDAEKLAARPEAPPSAKAAKREAQGAPVRARDLRARSIIGARSGGRLARALDEAAGLAADALAMLAAAAGPDNRTAEGSATA